MALQTPNKTYDVRYEGQLTGHWTLRNRVVETDSACVYTVQWSDLTGGPPLSRTRLCKIWEYKASDNFDCEVSRQGFFDTLIINAPSTKCHGFDDFGQETDIDTLVAGEDAAGMIVGVISTASVGDVQSLEIQ